MISKLADKVIGKDKSTPTSDLTTADVETAKKKRQLEDNKALIKEEVAFYKKC